ncbi:hypothetical protein SESBI_34437 [Sesbania bispinosa]|nr:hypothetical protein SESBI_34437 [Sesbania bispinosa]
MKYPIQRESLFRVEVMDSLIHEEFKKGMTKNPLNFDLKNAGRKRILQLDKLKEFRLQAYEISKVYKEKTKMRHNKKMILKEGEPRQQVLQCNSRLKLLFGKLKSRRSGPFMVKKEFPYGTIEVA